MNKNPMYLGLGLAIIIMIFSLIFYRVYIDEEAYFLLDNPTDKNCNIILNGQNYFLAPKQSVLINKLISNNSIKAYLNDSLVLKDTFFEIKSYKKGIINPLLQTYIIYNRFYGYINNKDSLLTHKFMTIDSIEYFGDIKTSNELLITNFYLNINQDYPKLLKKQDSMIGIPKIFRKNQFIKFYNKNIK